MSSTVASNPWAEIVHHASNGILEQRWLPGQMTDGAFKVSLALLALEAERLRPSARTFAERRDVLRQGVMQGVACGLIPVVRFS